MKRYFFLFLMLFLGVLSAFSQNVYETRKNQLTLGVGLFTYPEFKDFVLTVGTLGSTSYNNTSGTISLQYLRFVTPRLGIGTLFSVEHLWGIDEGFIQDKNTDISQTNYVIMPTASYYWLQKEHFGLYSKAGAGINLISCSEGHKDLFSKSGREFAFQIALVGIELGGQTVRFYAELGYGHQGSNMGIRFIL